MKYIEADKCICGCLPEFYHIENKDGYITSTFIECNVCEVSTYFADDYGETFPQAIKFWNDMIAFVKDDLESQLN